MMAAALLLAGVAFYGAPLARALDARLRGFTLGGAAFLIGAGAVALHLFFLSVLHVPWTRTSVLVSLIPLLALAVVRNRFRGRAQSGEGPLTASRAQLFFDLATLAIVVAYAVFATWAPPYEWDFYGIWGLKARWFFEDRGMLWPVVQAVSKQDYPVLLPLLFDFVAVVTGGWNDRAFGLIYVGLCVAFLAVARGMFAEDVRWPGLAALAIAFPAMNLWVGLGEAGVMAFGCAGLLFIRRGRDAMGAVLLGLAAWSKNEGLALIVVTAFALLVTTRSVRRVLALWPAAVVIAPWIVTRSVLHLSTDFMEGSVLSRVLDRMRNPGEVVHAFVASPPDQPWFWLAAIVSVIVFLRPAIRRELFLLIVVTLQLGLMVGQALATKWDLAAHVSLTMNRIPHQIAPALGFLAVLLLMREWSELKIEN
jgi:hypothetical protein